MVVTIKGKWHYLWRAVDQDGDVQDILLQERKDKQAAKRFFRKLLKGQGRAPNRIVTDKLPSYRAARHEMKANVPHCRDRYLNNRAEVSHEHAREGERIMRGFRSRWARRSAFSASTAKSTICFGWGAIFCAPKTIEPCAGGLSRCGKR